MKNNRVNFPLPFPLFMSFLSLALAFLFFAALFSGSVFISLSGALNGLLFILRRGGDEIAAALIFEIRLPRVLLACLAGASLGTSGACFQGLFRNSLADPYIIGASSGAALGAALAISLGGSGVFGFFSVLGLPGVFAFAGSFGACFLAFIISRAGGNSTSPLSLILAGTSISAFCSALLALILVIKDRSFIQIYYWLLGSLSGTTWLRLLSSLPFMLLGNAVIFLSARPLDLLLQGEQPSESLGLDPSKTRYILALAATAPVAAAVSVSGVIGFVGLIAPHASRFFTGPGHRRLLPAAALMGALLTLAADTLGRSLMPPMELPIGVITSLAGAPFFLFLLVHYRSRKVFHGA